MTTLGIVGLVLIGLFAMLIVSNMLKVDGSYHTMKTPVGVWEWIEANRPATGYVKGAHSKMVFQLPDSTDAIIVDAYHTTENKMHVRTADQYSYAPAGIDPTDIYRAPYVFTTYDGKTGFERATKEVEELRWHQDFDDAQTTTRVNNLSRVSNI